MPNTEMKAEYRDLQRAKQIAQSIGATLLWSDTQQDTYFFTKTGKLKLRQSSQNGSELLPYKKTQDGGTNRSDYARIPIESPQLVQQLLAELLGSIITVKKNRTVYIFENVRIHLDDVEELGTFLEFEAVSSDDTTESNERDRRKVLRLMEQFEVLKSNVLEVSYPDLLARKRPGAALFNVYDHHPEKYRRLVSCEDMDGTLPKTLQNICSFAGKNIVELGAGTGRLTRIIAPWVKRLIAFDQSRAMLDVASKHLADLHLSNWRFALGEHSTLPVPDQSADVVIAGWTIGHYTDSEPNAWEKPVEKALQEMKRVVKPGGTLIILETLGTGSTTPTPPNSALAAYYDLLERKHQFSKQIIRTDYRFGSTKEAKDLMEFFFGKRSMDFLADGDGVIIPENTGIWHWSG